MLPQYTGWTALHGAAYGGHISVVKYLIDAGSDISAMSSVCQRHVLTLIARRQICGGNIQDGDTPLHYAVRGAHQPVVEVLLQKGADLMARNKVGEGGGGV